MCGAIANDRHRPLSLELSDSAIVRQIWISVGVVWLGQSSTVVVSLNTWEMDWRGREYVLPTLVTNLEHELYEADRPQLDQTRHRKVLRVALPRALLSPPTR